MLKPKKITKEKLDKINLHERFSKEYGIPMHILSEMLIQLDIDWRFGNRRFKQMSIRLYRFWGIEINCKKVRYIYKVFDNYQHLYKKLCNGGYIEGNVWRELYRGT